MSPKITSLKHLNILVIDDEPDYLHIAARILSTAGYTVETAGTAKEGIHKATSNPPNLIVLDVGLPDMSGIEVTKRLKAACVTASIPIILFTVHSELTTVKIALSAGAAGYIIKPFEPDSFIANISRHIKSPCPPIKPQK